MMREVMAVPLLVCPQERADDLALAKVAMAERLCAFLASEMKGNGAAHK
jgi:hypothetical protein